MWMQFLSVSDRNKPGVTSQKTKEFLQWKTVLALVSTVCSLLYTSSSLLMPFKERTDVTTWWLPNVILDVLCFLTNDYYKIMDMFPDHTFWVGKPINGPFPSKGQIRCQGAFLNSGMNKVMFSTHTKRCGIVQTLPSSPKQMQATLSIPPFPR